MCVFVCLCVFDSSLEEPSAEPQVMEVSTEPLSISTPLKENKEKFYVSSGLTDGVLQQVEVRLCFVRIQIE